MRLKINDKVKVIAGKHSDKNKTGIIKKVDKKNNRIIVEGIKMISKHTKPSAKNAKGGIVKKEGFIDASNVMLVCPKCSNTTRVKYDFIQAEETQKKVRVCKKCKEQIDNI